MSLGLIGKKVGMTHVFDDDGNSIPVTVVDVTGNQVVQVKRSDGADGYSAAQVAFDEQKEQRLNKAKIGHLSKNGADNKRVIQEFRFESDETLPEAGKKLSHRLFQKDQYVDVIGTTKGKGFQGVYRRYGFGGLRATHGSMMHRRTGAIGAGSTPGRVWKNQKMPGRMGGRSRTIQNLIIVDTRKELVGSEGQEEEREFVLIRGNFPGNKGSYVTIRPAIKKVAPEPLPEEEEIVAEEVVEETAPEAVETPEKAEATEATTEAKEETPETKESTPEAKTEEAPAEEKAEEPKDGE